MSAGNFGNGSLVLRIWRFDGGSEVIAKFQYFSDAKAFAHMAADRDAANLKDWFYLAVCDNECEAQTFGVKEPPQVLT